MGYTKENSIAIIFSVLLLCICFSKTGFISPTIIVYAEENLKDNENANKLWKHLKDKGATDWWAAASIGNAKAELGLSTSLKKNPSGYWGAFQFKGDRQQDFKSWCNSKGYEHEDIVAQYEWFIQVYRGDCCKDICGISIKDIEFDTKYIKDAESAASYFAAGMEGCVCYTGITNGVGTLIGPAHTSGHECGIFDFSSSGSKWGEIGLQHLKKRIKYSQMAYDAFSGSYSGSSSTSSSSNYSTLSEDSITGMPDSKGLLEGQDSVKISKREDLGTGEQYSLSQISEGININSKVNALDLGRKLVAFVGLVLVSYATIIFTSMVFDKVNTFIDISVVKLVTFNLVEYRPNDIDNSLGKYISTKKLIISTIILLCVGLLILSGSIFEGLSQFVWWFSQKFL